MEAINVREDIRFFHSLGENNNILINIGTSPIIYNGNEYSYINYLEGLYQIVLVNITTIITQRKGKEENPPVECTVTIPFYRATVDNMSFDTYGMWFPFLAGSLNSNDESKRMFSPKFSFPPILRMEEIIASIGKGKYFRERDAINFFDREIHTFVQQEQAEIYQGNNRQPLEHKTAEESLTLSSLFQYLENSIFMLVSVLLFDGEYISRIMQAQLPEKRVSSANPSSQGNVTPDVVVNSFFSVVKRILNRIPLTFIDDKGEVVGSPPLGYWSNIIAEKELSELDGDLCLEVGNAKTLNFLLEINGVPLPHVQNLRRKRTIDMRLSLTSKLMRELRVSLMRREITYQLPQTAVVLSLLEKDWRERTENIRRGIYPDFLSADCDIMRYTLSEGEVTITKQSQSTGLEESAPEEPNDDGWYGEWWYGEWWDGFDRTREPRQGDEDEDKVWYTGKDELNISGSLEVAVMAVPEGFSGMSVYLPIYYPISSSGLRNIIIPRDYF